MQVTSDLVVKQP